MDLLNQILQQAPHGSHRFDEFRKILLQMDREGSRKKSIAGLTRLSQSNDLEIRAYAFAGLAMAHFLDNDYARSLFWLKETISKYSLSPLSLFAATLMVLIYRTLGMKRERFEAEGSRFLIMKKIAMQSDNPSHRILALNELKKEFEERELHDEAEKCDVELNYWLALMNRKAAPRKPFQQRLNRSSI
jgi:hypothetical protein